MSDAIEQLRARFPHASDSFLRLNAKELTPPTYAIPANLAPDGARGAKGEKGLGLAGNRLRQRIAGLNKTEAAFLECIRASNPGRQMLSQAVTLLIANGCRYTPDVFTFAGGPEAWEVKGFMRDDAAVKIKVAATFFPDIRFHLVTKRTKAQGGGWDIQEVMP